jgi:hypothetical protein
MAPVLTIARPMDASLSAVSGEIGGLLGKGQERCPVAGGDPVPHAVLTTF